jgi:AraC-like DNA-binding protein
LSPRTLHRRLQEEGSSFQASKDAWRRDLAISRLATSKTSTDAQIAADLGFADSAAFYRAFLRWTGMAPAHYRKKLQEAGGGHDAAASPANKTAQRNSADRFPGQR